jgi:replicative DNA helicase
MEHCRAAERALVAALVLGEVNPADLAGRLFASDLTDPVAAACFEALADRSGVPGAPAVELPELLRRRGGLRRDGYPISVVLGWLSTVPAPVHPEAWATRVIASSLARTVQASGTRIVQAVDSCSRSEPEPGRALAVAAAQRAAVLSALHRWYGLPSRWRDTVPTRPVRMSTVPAAIPDPSGGAVEREVVAGVVAAPVLLERLHWLRADDFTDPGCAALFRAARQLHETGRPVDPVTLGGALAQRGNTVGAEEAGALLRDELRPEQAFPAGVPFLARRLVQAGVLRQTRAVGERLSEWGSAPAASFGLGRPVLAAALSQLDRLRPLAMRLHEVTPAAPRPAAQRTSRAVGRQPTSQPMRPVPDRYAG